MADQTNNTPKRPNANVEDPNFVFGEGKPKQKIDAWEGEGEVDLVSDAGEMSLANLHFGSTEQADFTKSGAEKDTTETDGKPVDGLAIDNAVSVDVLENDAGAVIGSISSFDPASSEILSYTVSDERFEIVNGDLRLVEGVSLDFEDAASLDVVVTGADKDGNTITEAFAIDVIDVNDAPMDLELDGNMVAENDAGAVIGTLSAFDPDADDALTYTVSDDRFEVVDGELRLADGVSLNHEEAANIDVTVTVTDSGGLETSETFTIDVADVNEGPTDLALDGDTVAENDAGATVGTLSSFDPDAGDTVTYTVSDDRFEVVDGELRLAEGVELNHEDAASIEVTVTATDADGLSTEEAFTIDVTDVNEGPSDLALDGNTVAENDAGATVGTLSSFDPDAGDSVTYTVSDDRFEVVDGELRLAEGVELNHEEAASIEVTVTATDADGLSTEEAFTIDVADVNEGPSDLALDGNSVAENDAGATVGTLSSFDPDAGDSVTYTVSDDRFEVVDGELRLADGVSLNHEDAASIEVTVTATDSDGLSTEEAFSIDVTDVNEGPNDLALDGNTVAENDAGATVGTLSSFDPDAGDSVTYTVSDDRFEVVDGELRLAEGVELNHEDAASIEVTVTATDADGLSTEEAFSIDVTDVNEGPSDLALDGNTVAENDAGATVGTLSSFDPDAGDSVTYTVSDDRFEVVDGELRLAEGVELNHEDAASIEVTVTATDGDGLSTEEAFTIDVTDVNEGPSDLALDGNSVAENDAGATVGTLSSFDPDAGDSVTYTVSDDRFEVVDGELRLAEGVELNHEDAASIEVTVTATDADGLSTQEAFSIDVTDVNEGPSDLALDGNTVAENDAGAAVGTLSSFDPDAGDTVTYTVSDDRFEVVDGELRLAEGVELNHEDAASIEVTVTATDADGLSTEEAFTIDVTDVNEGPSDLALDGNTVAENDAGATVGTLSSFDPDAGDSVTYTVSDDRFEVVDGELRLAEGVELNHEEAASIEVTVTATDADGLSTEEAFTIDVTDVNEGPSDLALDGNTVAENDAGATVGTLSSFDPDAGDSVTYTVSDDRFEVVDGELRLAEGVELNHEDAASIEVTVTATDADGLSTEEAFTIDVTDVNEGPSDLALDGNSVAENDAGATVGTLSSFDPDAGDSVTYTVSDDRFEVVDGELRLAEGVELNHEEAASIEVTVTATDGDGLSTEEAFTIDVTDVNEGPTDLALARETGLAESDFSANDGYSGTDVQNLGVESDAIVFTMSFTTAGDVSSTQTLFETGGSGTGTNVVIEDGMLLIYAGNGNDLELSIPIDGDTEYSFALELDTENDTIRVLLSDELPLEEMNAENSLVASLDNWTDNDYSGGNSMGVGDAAGGSTQGSLGGEFLGDIAEPGLQIFSDASIDEVFIETGVAENTEGAVVGTLSSFDPDAGDTVTYTVSDDRFEVVDGEVRLAEGVTLDYEDASSIDLTITATDSGGLSTSETFTVDVIDLNEAPTDLSLDGASIDENSTEGVVGTVSVTDPDAGDTHTFSLVDNDGQPFAIDAETGEISLISPGVPEGSVLHIDASETDSLSGDDGISAVDDLSQTDIAISQSNADQQPDFTNDGPFGGPGLQFDGENDRLNIADDSAINLSSQSERSFAMTIQTGEDVESRQVIYEEGGTVNGFNFYIDDGQLYMGAWSESTGWDFQAISMEVEPGESYSIVTVFDGDSGSYTAYVNGEEVGSIEVGDTMSGHSGNIGLGGVSQHTEFHDGHTTANEGYYFEGSVGEFVVYNEALDSADVTAIDMDFRGIDPTIDFETQDSYDLTVQVTDAAGESYQEVVTIDVNDLNEGPMDLTLDGSSVAENDAGATVGTLSSFDPDAGDSVTYTVSDDRFEVVDGELRLADGVELNHEDAASIEVTVTATDGDGQSIEEAFTIDVTDVNEGPTDLALDGNSVAENDAGATVGTLSSFDPDAGDSVTYTVSDDRFEVVDGELRLAEGVELNHEDAASIEVTVTATDGDGLSTEEAFTIDVADVNEGPSDLALDGNSVAENDAGATVGTLSSFDPDAGESVTYTVSDDRFEVVDGELRLADGVELNHEDAASIEVTVTATDGSGLETSESFDINVADVNEGPSDLALDGNTVAENDAGATVGTLSSFDPDAGDSVTYTVSDDRFEVVDGELRLADGVSLNHEDAASIEVTVTATDGDGLSTEEAFTIDVTDVNEGPSDLALDGNSVAENDAGATVGTLASFDPDAGDTVTYTVSDDRFEVVDGELRLAEGVELNHEDAASIEVTVTATDADGLSTQEAFTIDVTDISEGPSDLALDGNTVAENDAGATVGTLSSFDPDAGDSVTYTVSDDRFEVVDGELRLAEGVELNHEDAASIEVTVTATDSSGLETSESFDINVADVNEGPSDLALDGNTVAENDAGATVGTLSSFDPDADDSVTYTVSDDRFEVADGELRLAEGVELNHEDAASIEVTVTATDGDGLSTEEAFSIDVTDVNEGVSDLALDGSTVAENDAGATVGTLSSFDPDAGDSVTYTVSDDRFEVVDGELRLADGVSLDHEDAASIEVTVTATDGSGLETSESFDINVADVNEGPSDLALDGNTVAENDAGATVGTLSSFDPDAGDSVSYTVSDDRFEVVDGDLRLVDGVSLDHEEAASIEVTVTATDSGGLETSETFDINVDDVNEGPSDLTVETSSENLVSGGSFEEQSVGSGRWAGFGEDASGNWDSANGIEVWDNLGGTEAAAGDQFLELDYTSAADAISQTVSTESGQVYTLSLDVRARSAGADTDSIEVYWNGELVDVVDPSSTDWETVSFDVIGTGGEDVLEFREVEDQSNGLGAHMDNISLIEVPMTIAENVEGAVIGSVSAFDPDAGDAMTFTVSDDRFEVVDGDLRLVDGVSLDHEDAASLDIEVTATDSEGLATTESFTINVADVNEAPSDIELSTKPEAFLEQDGLLVIEAENYDSASDGSGGHAWGESDNAGMMHVDDGSNAYDMWKDENTVEQDSPELTYSIQIDTPGTYYVHILGTAEDGPRGNADSVHIGIDGERMTDDGGLTGFGRGGWGETDTYSGNVVEVTFDSAGTFDLNLWAREDGVAVDQIVLTQDPNFNPGAQDLTESPRVGGLSVDENEAGAKVATVSSLDQDAGDSVTYTVSDERFEVVDGDLKLAEGETLDYEAEQSVDITVTATDSEGAETSESFTIEVNDVADTDGGVTVKGSDGDDTLKGGTGNDEIIGGDGDDLFIYEADGGSDSFDGGSGWTDTIDLSNAVGDDAVYGDDWTVTLTDGEIISENADSLEFSDDASGYIELDNGETIDFSNVEQIGF